MASLMAISPDKWVQIGLFILALLIVWFVIRFLFRLTMRLFSIGCGAILILGLALLVMRYLAR